MAPDGLSLSAGPFVTALEYATGRSAVIMGKPSKDFFNLALADMGLDAGQTAMIGDDVITDICGAQAAGIKGILVKTGKYREDSLRTTPKTPDLVIDSIAHIREIF
jgi:ribonucleotide monophosphatase NagD (HAD superfamily)